MPTRTGNFPIGFRRGWSAWQKGSTDALATWAASAGFELLDLPTVDADDLATLKRHNLTLGTADLPNFGKLLAADAGERRAAVEAAVAAIDRLGPLGVRRFFTVVIVPDPTMKRADAYKLAVETHAPIAEAAARHDAHLVIEGWPGMDPHLSNLCCTPETCRAFLRDLPRGVALNYDPSHLIRLGVDPLRFLREFVPHVRHVHAKDTIVDAEARYEFGTQSAAFTKAHGFGGHAWRYTLPGHGMTPWREVFRVLSEVGYAGGVSIELEDENFNGADQTEQLALTATLAFLRAC